MESEMDLDEDLKKFQMLATAPHLYADFVTLNAVASIVGLLAHENTGAWPFFMIRGGSPHRFLTHPSALPWPLPPLRPPTLAPSHPCALPPLRPLSRAPAVPRRHLDRRR